MRSIEIFTIGVYGSNEESFFASLGHFEIDLFIDIRRKRGMRGSQYRFANSSYLQKKLNSLGVDYLHLKELSPTDDIRQIQKDEDKKDRIGKRRREVLSETFVQEYTKRVIKTFDIEAFLDSIEHYSNIVFFCVEQQPAACHRSIVSYELSKVAGLKVTHISSSS